MSLIPQNNSLKNKRPFAKSVSNTIGILIINWNCLDDTISLLNDLHNQKYIKPKLLVIDNGSKNQSILTERLKSFKDVQIILNNKNNGVAPVFNQGIKELLKSNCKYIMLLNADVLIPDKLFLKKMLLELKECKYKKKIMSPKILYEHNKKVWFEKGYLYKKFVLTTHNNPFPFIKKIENDFLTGCCILFDKNFINEVGFYDENFFAYFEDTDISIRAKQKDYKLITNKNITILHKKSATTSKNPTGFSRIHIYLWNRNTILFAKKYLSFLDLIFFFIPSRFIINIYWFSKANYKLYFFIDCFRGIKDGILNKLSMNNY